jgi:TetR/AcrR family transcriptional repressor of nem operon
MARPREFDREQALEGALELFWQKGFNQASTDELLDAMQIRRQSLYNAFGDKRKLFLETLERYCARSISGHVSLLKKSTSPLAGIQEVMFSLIREDNSTRLRGCMGVNSICEFGTSDPEVAEIRDRFASILQTRLVAALRDGQASGEVDPDMDPNEAATFVQMTLSALQVGARVGTDIATLRAQAQFAINRLRSRL